MIVETEGIVLRKTEMYNNVRMVTLLTKKYGKISCATTLPEKGRKKGSFAVQPFSYGIYNIFKSRRSIYLNSFEPKKSFFKIGEDIEKYACGAYALEFTDKLTPEEEPVPEIFNLLIDYMSILDVRNSNFKSLLLAYLIKLIQKDGIAPELKYCVSCEKNTEKMYFSVEEGGLLCEACKKTIIEPDTLIYVANFGIIDVVKYILNNPLHIMAKVAVDTEIEENIFKVLKHYCSYHLGIDKIKSEEIMSNNSPF